MVAGEGGSWSDGIHSQKQRDGYLGSVHFLPFIQPRTPAHGVVLPTEKAGFPFSFNPIQIIIGRCAQRLAFKVILDSVKLTNNSNCQINLLY